MYHMWSELFIIIGHKKYIKINHMDEQYNFDRSIPSVRQITWLAQIFVTIQFCIEEENLSVALSPMDILLWEVSKLKMSAEIQSVKWIINTLYMFLKCCLYRNGFYLVCITMAISNNIITLVIQWNIMNLWLWKIIIYCECVLLYSSSTCSL
jgi:hypothetical protein